MQPETNRFWRILWMFKTDTIIV